MSKKISITPNLFNISKINQLKIKENRQKNLKIQT